MGRPPLDRKASNTVKFLVAFPKSTLKRIKAYADKHDITPSAAIRELVEKGLEK